MRSDDDIKRDVENELRWDPEITLNDIIGVAVRNGIVTLTGFVRGYDEKVAAEAAAKRVAGVVAVANDIEVRLPGEDAPPDPDIVRDAIAMIETAQPDIAGHIKVTASKGWVTLEGEVERNDQREVAERVARYLKGVTGVTNLIQVRSKLPPTEDIKHQIEEAFRRNAELDANRIAVEAKGGEVILTGTVRSWAERQEAERVAWMAPGVVKVENRIAVSP